MDKNEGRELSRKLVELADIAGGEAIILKGKAAASSSPPDHAALYTKSEWFAGKAEGLRIAAAEVDAWFEIDPFSLKHDETGWPFEDVSKSYTPGSFAAAVKLFEQAQDKYNEYGAGDTEPDAQFQLVMRSVYQQQHKDPMIPRTAEEWQLLNIRGSDKAANALTAATQVVVDAADRFPVEFGEWARAGNLWRVDVANEDTTRGDHRGGAENPRRP